MKTRGPFTTGALKQINRISDHIWENTLQRQRKEMKRLASGQMTAMLGCIRTELRTRRTEAKDRGRIELRPGHALNLEIARLTA